LAEACGEEINGKYNNFYLPLLHVQGKKKEEQCRPNDTVLLFFLKKSMKRRRFGQNVSFRTKRVFSFKYGANTSTSKSVLNLSFVHFNCIPANFNRHPYS
jgi:hypothetical protein